MRSTGSTPRYETVGAARLAGPGEGLAGRRHDRLRRREAAERPTVRLGEEERNALATGGRSPRTATLQAGEPVREREPVARGVRADRDTPGTRCCSSRTSGTAASPKRLGRCRSLRAGHARRPVLLELIQSASPGRCARRLERSRHRPGTAAGARARRQRRGAPPHRQRSARRGGAGPHRACRSPSRGRLRPRANPRQARDGAAATVQQRGAALAAGRDVPAELRKSPASSRRSATWSAAAGRGIQTHLDAPRRAGIPNETAALVYRVAQEAVRNVVTHAPPSTCGWGAPGRPQRCDSSSTTTAGASPPTASTTVRRGARRPPVAGRPRRPTRRHAQRVLPTGHRHRVETTVPLDGTMRR